MLAFTLGLRFYRSKRYGALARFMSFASITGIAVGVMALIVGLSAMNGFERELKNRVLSVIPAAEISSVNPSFEDINACLNSLRESPAILALAPVIKSEAILTHGGNFAPIELLGIDPQQESQVIDIKRFINVPLDTLTQTEIHPQSFNVILGAVCAKRLNVTIGDNLDLIYVNKNSDFNDNPLAKAASASLKVVGILQIGGALDAAFALTSLEAAKEITHLNNPNSIHIKTSDMLTVRNDVIKAAQNFPEAAQLQTWVTSQGKLYNDIQMIRSIMNLVMILIMAVASFNIVSNLIMAVSEKSREIAVLLTLGASRGLIIKAFTIAGLLAGIYGIVIGTVCGLAIAFGLTPLTAFIERIFDIKFLNEEIYFIDFIPSQVQLTDVITIISCALIMSFLASLYPALKASAIKPAKELTGN